MATSNPYVDGDSETLAPCLRTDIWKNRIGVASIEIGNTFLRCKCLFFNEHKRPLFTDLDYKNVLWKIPSLLLLDNNGRLLKKGENALLDYEYYASKNNWHLFRDILQPLYHAQDDSVIYLRDVSGRSMTAVKVIGALIKHIKDKILLRLIKRPTGLSSNDICWVLTTPSAFSACANNTMRNALLEAGLAESQFRLITDTTAVLEYCRSRYLHNKEKSTYYHNGHPTSLTPASLIDRKQLMVVNIGDETLDITVFANDYSGHLTVLKKESRIGYGSRRVHDAFVKLLTSTVCSESCANIPDQCNIDIDFCRCIDVKIKIMRFDSERFIRVFIPDSLKTITEETTKVVSDVHQCKRYGDKLEIPSAVWRKIMSEFCSYIVKMIQEQYINKETQNLCLLLVGMYAESNYVQEAITRQLPDIDIFIPYEPEFATVIGAAILGHNPPQQVMRSPFVHEKDTTKYALDEKYNTVHDVDVVNRSDSLTDSVDCGSDFVNSVHNMSVSSGAIADKSRSRSLEEGTLDPDCREGKEAEDVVGAEDTSSSKTDAIESGSDFLTCLHRTSLSSDMVGTIMIASKLEQVAISFKQQLKGSPQTITVSRENITSDVIAAYGNIDVTKPLRVTFTGEEDDNVTEEMFGLFWEKISCQWFKGENAVIPVVPLEKRTEARLVFPVLGKILEHMLIITSYLPPQLCRSLLLAIAHPEKDVDAELVLEDFLLFLPERENELLARSLHKQNWPKDQKARLRRFLNVNNIHIDPTPQSLRECLMEIAYDQIVDSSNVYTGLMRRGISSRAREHLFNLVDKATVVSMYMKHEVTTESLARMVEAMFDDCKYTREEKVVLNYLINYIRDLNRKELRRFLLWLTGSLKKPEKIEVVFTASGRSKPIAKRVNNILELSRYYRSYQQFEGEVTGEIDDLFQPDTCVSDN